MDVGKAMMAGLNSGRANDERRVRIWWAIWGRMGQFNPLYRGSRG